MDLYFSKQKKLTKAYQDIFLRADNLLNPLSKIVLNDLALKSGAFSNNSQNISTSFVVNDPYSTAFNEGKRYLFNYLIYRLNLNIDEIYNLLKEQAYDRVE